MESKQRENAIDFLLYSYFGIAPEHSWRDMVRAAIIKAYNDATMQGAYNALFRKDIPHVDQLLKESGKARKSAATKLETELKTLFAPGGSHTDYLEWHKKICKTITECFADVKTKEKESFFTYGNAQKWVNMTIKYVYILDALSAKSEYGEQIKTYAKDFHVPVDRYIIEAVWDKNVALPLKEGANREKKYTYPAEYVVSWSAWNDNTTYSDFQTSLKTAIEPTVPIDWEGTAWINQAQIVKKNAKEDLEHRYPDFFE